MLSDQQQYRYMTVDDMKSMGDDSMRVNVTDDERDNRHSGGKLDFSFLAWGEILEQEIFQCRCSVFFKLNRDDGGSQVNY